MSLPESTAARTYTLREEMMTDAKSQRSLSLDQLLKLVGIAETGGQAKLMIQGGEVQVNGELETRRRRKLVAGDIVQFDGQSYSPDEFLEGE